MTPNLKMLYATRQQGLGPRQELSISCLKCEIMNIFGMLLFKGHLNMKYTHRYTHTHIYDMYIYICMYVLGIWLSMCVFQGSASNELVFVCTKNLRP